MTSPRPTRVLVTGSRDWTDLSTIRWGLSRVRAVENGRVLVHGGAAGADSMAVTIAPVFGFAVEEHKADWKTHGKRAGILRNLAMFDSGIDYVLAFHLNNSRGTAHALAEAERRGIARTVYSVANGDYSRMVMVSMPAGPTDKEKQDG